METECPVRGVKSAGFEHVLLAGQGFLRRATEDLDGACKLGAHSREAQACGDGRSSNEVVPASVADRRQRVVLGQEPHGRAGPSAVDGCHEAGGGSGSLRDRDTGIVQHSDACLAGRVLVTTQLGVRMDLKCQGLGAPSGVVDAGDHRLFSATRTFVSSSDRRCLVVAHALFGDPMLRQVGSA